MSKKLHIPKKGCDTCPYRRDTPSGIWSEEEYRKLAKFDEPSIGPLGLPDDNLFSTFHCHQENATGKPTACRGWVWTHGDTVGFRMAMFNGLIDPSDPNMPQEDESHIYYDTGVEACEAGMVDIEEPSFEALLKVDSLVERGAGRRDEV